MNSKPHSVYTITVFIAVFFLLFKLLHHFYGYDWRYAAGFSYGLFLIVAIYSIWRKNEFLNKILLFGLLAGITELISDWWLVDYKHSLVYPLNEPMLLASPLYMPISWAVIFLQIGMASYYIYQRKNIVWAAAVAVLCGTFFVPFFEYWAKLEGWWYYQHCNMVADAVPYYIILSEALICVVLPFVFIQLKKRNYIIASLLGIGQGLWIWLTCMAAYYITQ